MKFTPIGDRLLILPDEAESQSKGGIIIPDTAKEKMYRGAVVSSAKPAYLPGCRVMYSKYGGTEVKIDEVLHIVIAERDVLGVIEDD